MDLTPKGYKEVSRAWLFQARESWTLPVLSRGLLYVVQNTREINRGSGPRLLCYDLRRSEEHTSELQSQSNLVCRLLLEKKKKPEMTSSCSISNETTTTDT